MSGRMKDWELSNRPTKAKATAADIAAMPRSEYLAWCAEHLNARHSKAAADKAAPRRRGTRA